MIMPIAHTVILMVSREFTRVRREPSRIVGMLLQPLVFLLVFGLGFHRSFRLEGQVDISYAAFFYPGILGLVVLFAAIYATLTLVDDKKCGFFRLVLVSPAGVSGAITGKVVATMLLGFAQSLLFLPLLYFLPIKVGFESLGAALVLLLIGCLCFALLGVGLAWVSPSPSAFHALMSILLIPMWLLSGAMFPLDNAYLALASYGNPMAYLVSGLRACLLGLGTWAYDAGILLIFCVLIILLLGAVIRKKPLE